MKILCVIDSLEAGGAQRQLVGLGTAFKRHGHDVSFLTYHDFPFYLPLLEDAAIPYICISEKSYIKRLLRARKFIRKGNYDVVLSFLEGPSFLCELIGLPFRRWKLIVGERNAKPSIARSPRSILFRFFHHFADKVVANSHANLELVKKAVPFLRRRKMAVVYNMVDFDEWVPASDYYFDADKGFVSLVVIGRHANQKNLNGLIDGLMSMREDLRIKIRVSWYGDRISPPYYDSSFPEAKEKIKKLGLEQLFEFYPATQNILSVIQHADVIGLFSHYEGFPNVICEGMACGKPVIASRVSDVPLIVTNRNFTFDQNDPREMARVLEYIVSLDGDTLQEEGKKNRRTAIDFFNMEKIVADYLSIIDSLRHEY